MAYISKITLQNGTKCEIKDSYAREQLASIEKMGITDNNAYIHNALPRCKNIQTYFDNGKLYEKISDGSFDDLFIGDYFKATYNGVSKTFRIAGFNMFYYRGGMDSLKNHAVIVPDESLGEAYMNSSNITTGGYYGSYMYKTKIGAIASAGGTESINANIYTIFGTHLLTTRDGISSSVNTNGTSTAGAGWTGTSNGHVWTNYQAILMSEVELYGANVYSSSGYDTGGANMQLPLFRLIPQMKHPGDYWYWLRNVSSSNRFCCCDYYGNSWAETASLATGGVRPRFVIG